MSSEAQNSNRECVEIPPTASRSVCFSSGRPIRPLAIVAYELLLPYTDLAGDLVSQTKYFGFRLSSCARSGLDAVFTFTCISPRCTAIELFYGPASMLKPAKDELVEAPCDEFFQRVSFDNHRFQRPSIVHACSGLSADTAANGVFRDKLRSVRYTGRRRIAEIRSHIDLIREEVNAIFPGFSTENSEDELIDIVLRQLK
ncbi:Oidioi.mRNA.OKI2018_I69.PAR.g11991.t1.cds [Oikopleura dioica]|uniref:Oidioi.mRNA.OKI2018_I69.PAR.g11991.t1.cds n=1 Tax=Oikopleura dioica TaxID=34765 RepID=A0ABN7S3T7_OIKDI|nr:Oidioi.mRNA.OKI2018_I69.PAR.g11991.t1.cds [Oikopleura dioica]